MAYVLGMEFEWDDGKSEDCFARRGFDFAYAARAFLDPQRIVARDMRRDYGEDRYNLVGTIEGRAFAVAFTMRGSVIRIISARKASRKEVAQHGHDTHHD